MVAPSTMGRPALPSAGVGNEGLAELASQRRELDAALRHVTDGIADLRQLNYRVPLAWGLATLAWIRQARGDQVGALEAMGEAERVAPSPSLADVVVPAQRARLLLAQGDVVAAACWAEERRLGPGGRPHPAPPARPRACSTAAGGLSRPRRGRCPGPGCTRAARPHRGAQPRCRNGRGRGRGPKPLTSRCSAPAARARPSRFPVSQCTKPSAP
jgi:hypothetical protein